jgi:FkbM family methyltransferase
MWLVCAGAKRSGSTLQYNILASLVEESGTGKRISHFKQDEFAAVKEKHQNYSGFKVIKSHILSDELKNEIISGHAKVFHSFRDIRDVIVSYINKGWIDGSMSSITRSVGEYLKDYDTWVQIPQIYSRKYEEFAFNMKYEIGYYAQVLDLTISEKIIEDISKNLNLEQLKKSQGNIAKDKLKESYNNVFHEDTLLHINHIYDGSMNQFINSLNIAQISKIESIAYKYLISNNYKLKWTEYEDFVSFSQHADDYLAWQILGKRRRGVVVEVGAFDGHHLSNSYSLEQLGWQSICVEPNPDIFNILENNRPNSKNFDCAVVGDKSVQEIDFYSEEIGVLSGCDYDEEDVKKRYKNRGLVYKDPKKVKVKARTLSSILESAALNDNTIDVISVDVEGFEIEVLKGLRLDRFNVGLFIIEANTDNDINAILNYFKNYPKYVNIGSNRQNLFLLHKNWVNKDCLRNLDFENYIKAVQKHPINEELTLDSVPPKFVTTKDFQKLLRRFNLF